MSARLILYTRNGCHLCEEVKQRLTALSAEFDFTLTEFDIDADPALYDRFRYLIPVLDLDTGPLLYAPISEADLRRALAALPA